MLRPMAREPLCLFLVTSASWRLRGVKRPQQRSNGEQPQRAPVIAGRGSLAVFFGCAERRIFAETPARAAEPRILVVVTGNFLHKLRDAAPQGGIINSHERSDQP